MSADNDHGNCLWTIGVFYDRSATGLCSESEKCVAWTPCTPQWAPLVQWRHCGGWRNGAWEPVTSWDSRQQPWTSRTSGHTLFLSCQSLSPTTSFTSLLVSVNELCSLPVSSRELKLTKISVLSPCGSNGPRAFIDFKSILFKEFTFF